MIYEKSAGVVLYTEDKNKKLFLLLNYPSGHWDFVKGKIEDGETEHQTVLRETKEETGIIDLEFVDGFKENIEYEFTFDQDLIQKKVIFFLAKTNTKTVNLSHEHLDYVWLDFDEVIKKVTYQNAKQVLLKTKKFF